MRNSDLEKEMAFVNEKIPQDVLDSFDFSVFKGMFGEQLPQKMHGNRTWVRDKNRGAFLLWTGGGGGPHVDAPREDKFALWWKGDIAYFIGEDTGIQTEKGWVTTWKKPARAKDCIELPNHLKTRRAEFIVLVKEALAVQGTRVSDNPNYNSIVTFDFE